MYDGKQDGVAFNVAGTIHLKDIIQPKVRNAWAIKLQGQTMINVFIPQ